TPHTVVTPRASATLERRRQWERRYRMRLRLSDAAMITGVTALTALVQLFAFGTPGDVLLRNGTVLVVGWYLTLSVLNSRSAAIFGSGATEYRRVANASGFAFGALAIIGVLLEWEGLRPLLLITLPVGMLGLLTARWSWRRWLQRRRLAGEYASRTLVVGSADDVEYVVDSLLTSGENGYHVVGATLLDRNAGELELGESVYPVVGNINTVAAAAAQLSAD